MSVQTGAASVAPVWPESYTVRCSIDLGLIDLPVDSVALRSDCVDARADLELHWPYMFEDPFSHDAAHIKVSVTLFHIKVDSVALRSDCAIYQYYLASLLNNSFSKINIQCN